MMAMEQNVEKRRHPRQEVFSAIMVTPNGDRHSAHVLDLSLGGARLDLPAHWSPHDGAALRMFFMVGDDHTVVLRGRVARVAVDHLGVQFDPAQEEDIRELLYMMGKRA